MNVTVSYQENNSNVNVYGRNRKWDKIVVDKDVEFITEK